MILRMLENNDIFWSYLYLKKIKSTAILTYKLFINGILKQITNTQ